MSHHTESIKAEPERIGVLYADKRSGEYTEMHLLLRGRDLFPNDRESAQGWTNKAVRAFRQRKVENGDITITN